MIGISEAKIFENSQHPASLLLPAKRIILAKKARRLDIAAATEKTQLTAQTG